VPAAFSAERAKSFAEERLSRLWAGRETAKVHLPWRRCAMMPATKVRIEGEGGTWHAVRWTLHNMVTTLELTREVHASSDAASIPATPGRPIAEPDQPHGPTKLLLFDLRSVMSRSTARGSTRQQPVRRRGGGERLPS
jgi:hypothetical protein